MIKGCPRKGFDVNPNMGGFTVNILFPYFLAHEITNDWYCRLSREISVSFLPLTVHIFSVLFSLSFLCPLRTVHPLLSSFPWLSGASSVIHWNSVWTFDCLSVRGYSRDEHLLRYPSSLNHCHYTTTSPLTIYDYLKDQSSSLLTFVYDMDSHFQIDLDKGNSNLSWILKTATDYHLIGCGSMSTLWFYYLCCSFDCPKFDCSTC